MKELLNAYKLIQDSMIKNGFIWKQGNIYFGRDKIDAVTYVLVVQKLAKNSLGFQLV